MEMDFDERTMRIQCDSSSEVTRTCADDDLSLKKFQLDQDWEEGDETNSDFIRELLKNEQKLTQAIYPSKLKVKQSIKVLQKLLVVIPKNSFLSFMTLVDLCNFKRAFQLHLSHLSIKMIDSSIMSLIWTRQLPNSLILWDTLINGCYLQRRHPSSYQQHCGAINLEYERNIRMDLDRTFPEREDFQREESQEKLFRVLNALTSSVKDVGYIQGWNQIVGVFLLFPEFPEEMVYWIMNYLMQKVSLKDLYISIQNGNITEQMEQANQLVRIKQDKESSSSDEDSQISSSHTSSSMINLGSLISLDYLLYSLRVYLKVYMNPLFRILEETEYTIYPQKWFTLLFSQQLPPQITLCLLAGTILEDWNYLIRIALSLFDILRDKLENSSDCDEIMEILSNVRCDSFEISKEEIWESMNKFEVSNQQLLQLKQVFDEKSDIDSIQLIDGSFYHVEQVQRKDLNSLSSGSNFFERVGSFLFPSPIKHEPVSFIEERREVNYERITNGTNILNNKFSEIIHQTKRHIDQLGDRNRYLELQSEESIRLDHQADKFKSHNNDDDEMHRKEPSMMDAENEANENQTSDQINRNVKSSGSPLCNVKHSNGEVKKKSLFKNNSDPSKKTRLYRSNLQQQNSIKVIHANSPNVMHQNKSFQESTSLNNNLLMSPENSWKCFVHSLEDKQGFTF